jgi:hypothetical protein
MEYSAERTIELVCGINWKNDNYFRIFWVRCPDQSRAVFADSIRRTIGNEAIVPVVVRGMGFRSANAVLADVLEIIEENKLEFAPLDAKEINRVTVLLLAKDEFRLPQGGSPIRLPNWFPVLPGVETFFHIADLGLSAEVRMLDCQEARIEHISSLVLDLERAIIEKLKGFQENDANALQRFLDAAHAHPVLDRDATLIEYDAQLKSVLDPRKYRPNAATDATTLISRLLKLVLNNAPKQLAASAKTLANCFKNLEQSKLKATLFATMLRPAAKMDQETASWHAILLSFYQAYQLMNGAAHAGEYPHFSVALQFANSANLRQFLSDAREYVESLS